MVPYVEKMRRLRVRAELERQRQEAAEAVLPDGICPRCRIQQKDPPHRVCADCLIAVTRERWKRGSAVYRRGQWLAARAGPPDPEWLEWEHFERIHHELLGPPGNIETAAQALINAAVFAP